VRFFVFLHIPKIIPVPHLVNGALRLDLEGTGKSKPQKKDAGVFGQHLILKGLFPVTGSHHLETAGPMENES
jgi:hypothetical protein